MCKVRVLYVYNILAKFFLNKEEVETDVWWLFLCLMQNYYDYKYLWVSPYNKFFSEHVMRKIFVFPKYLYASFITKLRADFIIWTQKYS